jgi:hypothetical protein
LHATRQQGDAHSPIALRWIDFRLKDLACNRLAARKLDQIPQPRWQDCGGRPGERRQAQGQCKAPRIWQHFEDHASQHPFAKRSAIIVLDVSARDIDQVRVVNLDRARPHAGQA